MKSYKIKFYKQELIEFTQLIGYILNELRIKSVTDPKEINIYRQDNLEKLFKRFVNISMHKEIKNTTPMNFDLIDMLTIRYCIIVIEKQGKGDIFYTKIFMDINAKINPKMFDRS